MSSGRSRFPDLPSRGGSLPYVLPVVFGFVIMCAPVCRAQQLASPSPAATAPPAAPSPTAGSPPPLPSAPAPVPPGVVKSEPAPTPPADAQETLVDALNPGELQEAINLLRANYVRPGDVDDRSLARATLAGLLDRLDHGAMLLPKPGGGSAAAPAPEQVPDAFRAEVLGERTGYVRLGALTRDHLNELDKAVKGFAEKKLPALIFDLRATGGSSDYELAAEVIRRFVAKGKPLFTLRKPSNNQERLFTSNGDPIYNGTVLFAVDADTTGAVETVAAVIRYYNRALVFGANTAGQAVEYTDLRLSGGTLLRVAVSQVLLPANLSIFPNGVKPDLAVPMPHADKLAVFRQSLEKGVAPFVFETERPHFNEAALVSGLNPELDAARDLQAARRRGDPPPKPPLRDPVIQHALDVATSLPVLDVAGKP